MKKSDAIRNVKVLAVNNENKDGFDIFLDFSGQQEFVMHHRYNGLIYPLLSDGIPLDDLRRWKPKPAQRQVNGKLVKMVSYSLKVIDEYINECLPYETKKSASNPIDRVSKSKRSCVRHKHKERLTTVSLIEEDISYA
ncbi:hypothetical protein [Acetobacterium wieringae]|uniref:hypothetical protein n=1 Tax=Acetobacterium wieringae TaxID=52694 RepID=UPI003B9EACEA